MELKDCGILREDILNGVVNKLVDGLEDDMQNDIDNRIRSIIDEQIAKQTAEVVEKFIWQRLETITTQLYQPTNSWGEQTGEPTTLIEVVKDQFLKWWTTIVDNSGNAVRGYCATKQTRAEYYVKLAAKDALDKEVKAEFRLLVATSKKEMSAAVSKAMSAIVAKYYGNQ